MMLLLSRKKSPSEEEKKEKEAEESKWKNEMISVLKTQTQKKGKITIS